MRALLSNNMKLQKDFIRGAALTRPALLTHVESMYKCLQILWLMVVSALLANFHFEQIEHKSVMSVI